MATIVGGFAVSHTPTIGFAYDAKKNEDPVWKPIFDGFKPLQKWLSEKKPDVILYVFNDHITSFFLDHYSHFALGVGEEYHPADEGGGPRALPPFKGHTKLAQHIAFSLVEEEFDLSYFQGKDLDHGCFSPLSLLLPHEPDWPCKIVPFQCGVLNPPVPKPLRFWKIGRALRKAIESYPEDIKVAIAGTGGLSHQVHGERCGFINTPWDMEFLERLEKDPEGLTKVTIAEYAKLGGMEGAEVVMWLLMRGALSNKVKKLHQTYYVPSMTAISSVIFEDDSVDPVTESNEDFRKRMMTQYAGIEKLEGTYPYVIERSVKAFRLNRFLHSLVRPEFRKQFLADPVPLFDQHKLTAQERELVMKRDWRALMHYGVIFFLLEKFAAVVGTTNLHVYAAMRGQSLEDFMKTRNTQVLYSVAGDDDSKKTWDPPAAKA